jgi:hypothetical protein
MTPTSVLSVDPDGAPACGGGAIDMVDMTIDLDVKRKKLDFYFLLPSRQSKTRRVSFRV